MLSLYVGIHVAFQWNLFDVTDMTVSTFVLDSIRKSTDIDLMLSGVGLPNAFNEMYVACYVYFVSVFISM